MKHKDVSPTSKCEGTIFPLLPARAGYFCGKCEYQWTRAGMDQAMKVLK